MTRRRTKKTERSDAVLPALAPGAPAPRWRRNYHRWRALSLSLVYLVFAAHIIHWRITGKTLAPLELNEVMYTLELGIITAGFLFMCALVLGTLLFGRFFCSWACHILVLQDVCAWILRKLRIRQKPIRSRLLLLVPPLTACYMFLWPQIRRAWDSRAFPAFHFRTDSEGWASFVTDNFWRNLPNPPIIILTFLVCGFAIVYILGSRTFCTYVCPYGAIFALADRFSPGRIRVSDACQQCGTCTAVCTSGVRVHEDVKQHGMIVNPACMKDLDCISACPQGALSYGLGKPALFASYRSGGRFGLPYDFSWREELLAAFLFIVVLLSFRGLYSRIPFLLSLAMGAIFGYLAVMAVRLCFRSNVRLATVRLKALGRMTMAGWVYVPVIVLLTVLVGHSAFVRYHEFSGLKQAISLDHGLGGDQRNALAESAHAHLLAADRWGLVHNVRVERSLLATALYLDRAEDVDLYSERLLARNPYDASVRLRLGQFYASQGYDDKARRELSAVVAQPRAAGPQVAAVTLAAAYHALGELSVRRGQFDAAVNELQGAVAIEPDRATAHAALGSALAELGRIDAAIASLNRAVELDPALGQAHFNLGTLYAHREQFEQAIPCYERALAIDPEDADLRNNLGLALLRSGQLDRAREHLERAIELNPKNADAHFNLGVLFASRKRNEEASEHFATAVRLDPRYGRLLEGGPPG